MAITQGEIRLAQSFVVGSMLSNLLVVSSRIVLSQTNFYMLNSAI
jgi:hypothetical protein